MGSQWEKLWCLACGENGPAELLISADDPNIVGTRWRDGSVDTWYYSGESWRPVPAKWGHQGAA